MKSFASMGQNAEALLQDFKTKEHATVHLSQVSVIYICFIRVRLQKDDCK